MFTVEELGQEIAELAVHLDAATHRLLECIRQFDAECGWEPQGAVSCAHWLSWRIGLDPATAREKVRVARALGNLPAIDAALKSGQLSYAKVRALTRVATPETEAKLLAAALYSTGAQLERLCRGYRIATTADNVLPPPERSVRRRDLAGGMVKLEVILSPDEADLVLRALDRAREVTHEQAADASAETRACAAEEVSAETCAEATRPSRADGMVALAESYLAGNVGTGNGGERFQVMVHVDQDPLAPDGILSGTLDDGTRVSAETLRRVACDCGRVAVVDNSDLDRVGSSPACRRRTIAGGFGDPSRVPMTIGRRSRSIPPAIRRALRLRDRGCALPTRAGAKAALSRQPWSRRARSAGESEFSTVAKPPDRSSPAMASTSMLPRLSHAGARCAGQLELHGRGNAWRSDPPIALARATGPSTMTMTPRRRYALAHMDERQYRCPTGLHTWEAKDSVHHSKSSVTSQTRKRLPSAGRSARSSDSERSMGAGVGEK